MTKLEDKIKRLQKIKKTIKILDTKYKNKLIHISRNGPLKLSNIINTNKNVDSRFVHDTVYEKTYYNPNGLWVSYGSKWIKWTVEQTSEYCYEDNFLYSSNIYEIILDNKNILNINNLDELIRFHQKYAFYKSEGYNIDWTKVKEDFDGLIICPYLGNQIWNKINRQSNIFISEYLMDKYIKDSVKENIIKYPKFYLEWYRHWETDSGVIWRKRSIKKIIKIKI